MPYKSWLWCDTGRQALLQNVPGCTYKSVGTIFIIRCQNEKWIFIRCACGQVRMVAPKLKSPFPAISQFLSQTIALFFWIKTLWLTNSYWKKKIKQWNRRAVAEKCPADMHCPTIALRKYGLPRRCSNLIPYRRAGSVGGYHTCRPSPEKIKK